MPEPEVNGGVDLVWSPAAKMQAVSLSDMTSEDYFEDSYAHFCIHEKLLKAKVTALSLPPKCFLRCLS